MGRESRKQNRFTAKRLAIMALFVALSYAVSFLETPPIAGFLKLDFGNVFILLISLLFGPIEGVVVCLLKEGLRCLTSSTLCVGELANFVITSAFILLPSILYRYKKGIKVVVLSLIGGCFIGAGVALIMNRFVLLPWFYELGFIPVSAGAMFGQIWWILLLFNLVKCVLISVIVFLLYKRLSNFLKRWEQ